MSFIEARQLKKQYGMGSSAVEAVREISFDIDSGDFVAIMGESGAGKSTLLAIMGAMNAPTSGEYKVDDIDIYRLPSEKRADFRREYLGFVFQSFHLVPYLTVLENVMLPITTAPLKKKVKREMAMEALSQVGLDGKADRIPEQLSGGEKERVAVSRAIVNEPPILLADEPTGNLDSRNSGEIMKLLKRLNSQGMTVVMVTHSRECAGYSERIFEISDGCMAPVSDIKKSEKQWHSIPEVA